MSANLVCLCNFVTEKEILSALKKGAASTGEIQLATRAGSSCGRCLPQINELVALHEKEKPKVRQKKLNFGF